MLIGSMGKVRWRTECPEGQSAPKGTVPLNSKVRLKAKSPNVLIVLMGNCTRGQSALKVEYPKGQSAPKGRVPQRAKCPKKYSVPKGEVY